MWCKSYVAKTYMKQKYKNVEYTDINTANYIIMTNRTLYSEKIKVFQIVMMNIIMKMHCRGSEKQLSVICN